jgi:hypothetical protein
MLFVPNPPLLAWYYYSVPVQLVVVAYRMRTRSSNQGIEICSLWAIALSIGQLIHIPRLGDDPQFRGSILTGSYP